MLKKILLGLLIAVGAVVGGVYAFPEKVLTLAMNSERQSAGLVEETITVGDLKWHVLSGGAVAADGLPLVLIHGFGGNADHWTRTAKALTPKMRVIAPDLIGFGTSEAPAGGDYTIPTQVTRLHALLQQMGVTKAHFGGNSMGGWIAGAYAAAYPSEVASLWMLDSAGLNTTPSEMGRAMEAGQKLPLVVRSAEEFDARMGWVFVTPPPIPAPLKGVLMTRDIAKADHYDAVRAQLYGVSPWLDVLIPNTAAVDIPTFIVWGDKDRVLHPDGAAALAGLLPKSKVLIMSNIGHCPMLEVPAQTASDYLAWRNSSNL
ncbi:MAG: alpha/beta hydrolase [Pseudomonadota bacterium]